MASPRLFELRTYHATPGKLAALQNRFRDHTLALFDKHGFSAIAFWLPLDADGRPTDTLVYVLAFADREAADRAWTAFREDPVWIDVKAKSEEDGPLTSDIESVYMTPADFSALS